MDEHDTLGVTAAEVVLPAGDLAETLAFFTDRLGFRVEVVFPADAPRVAVVSGHGVRLRFDAALDDAGGVVRLASDDATLPTDAPRLAPNGTRIEWVAAAPAVTLPELVPSFSISRLEAGAWGIGRAGMQYRDLIPDRQGGRYIASHIRIRNGGPVPDWVHFHRVHFQLIYCVRGWVRVVYEDQGPPFVLRAGDAVLQPPTIRHRVLECSDGLEVVEVSCPAEHETGADHDLSLPTPAHRPDREFGGQRFVHHRAGDAAWQPGRLLGFEVRDLGIAAGTGGLASAVVARRCGAATSTPARHHEALRFTFVLAGSLRLERSGERPEPLRAGDAVVVPADVEHAFTDCSPDLELLEVGARA